MVKGYVLRDLFSSERNRNDGRERKEKIIGRKPRRAGYRTHGFGNFLLEWVRPKSGHGASCYETRREARDADSA